MGTGRKFSKTNMTRPKKTPAARRQRLGQQRKRLIDLGMDEAVVAKMNSQEVRKAIGRPAAVKPAE